VRKVKNLLLTLLLLAVVFAGDSSSTASQLRFWDVSDFHLDPIFYADESVSEPGIFGEVRAINFSNEQSGTDNTFYLLDEEGTAIYTRTVAAGSSHYNRSAGANYTVYGKITASIKSNWTGGGTLPSANLVSWFRLDEGTGNTTADQESVNTLELGTNSSNRPSWDTVGKINNATTLDGTSDWMRLNHSAYTNFTYSNAFAVVMWFYPVEAPGTNETYYIWHRGVLSASNATGENSSSVRVLNSSTVQFALKLNDTDWDVNYTETGLFSGNTWTQYAFVYNDSKAEIWKNGAKVANVTFAAVQTLNVTTEPFYFGDGYDSWNNSVAIWGAVLYDEIYIFNTTLDSTELGYLYSQDTGNHANVKVVSKR